MDSEAPKLKISSLFLCIVPKPISEREIIMPRQSRRLIGVLITLIGVVMATACGSATPSYSPSPDATVTAEEAPAQTNDADSLEGVWLSEGGVVEATIGAGAIAVKIVDGETKSLFWKGTFPNSAQKGDILLSEADVEALSSSIMGSSELVKPFTYEGDEILFEFSMMGTSTVIHVKK